MGARQQPVDARGAGLAKRSGRNAAAAGRSVTAGRARPALGASRHPCRFRLKNFPVVPRRQGVKIQPALAPFAEGAAGRRWRGGLIGVLVVWPDLEPIGRSEHDRHLMVLFWPDGGSFNQPGVGHRFPVLRTAP
jgi:hypothetical protein